MAELIELVNHMYPCVTRKRGEKLFEKFNSMLGKDDGIKLSLQGVEILSMSFLDGFISRLIDSNATEQVVFITDEPPSIDKLSRISEIRNVPLFFARDPSIERSVVPRNKSSNPAAVISDKDLIPNPALTD